MIVVEIVLLQIIVSVGFFLGRNVLLNVLDGFSIDTLHSNVMIIEI